MSTDPIRENDRQDIVEVEEEIYGDKLTKKQPETIRLLFLNINSIPATNNSPKNDMLYQSIVASEADVIGMSETNRNWYQIDTDHRWHERTKGWFENSHTILAHNTTDIESSSYQPGGNLLLSIGKASHRVIKSEKDPTGLGRWVSTRYRGRQNIVFRTIVAYRPCKSAGPNSSYMQQQRYFDIIGRNICPRKAIMDDLAELVQQCHQRGEQVVLMMDCNNNVREDQFRNWITSMGLIDGTYDLNHPTVPATFHRGSNPIDGLFLSESITNGSKKGISAIRFLPFRSQTIMG